MTYRWQPFEEAFRSEQTEPLERFGHAVMVIRTDMRYTRESVAEWSGIAPATVAAIENGYRALTTKTSLGLGRGLGVDPAVLWNFNAAIGKGDQETANALFEQLDKQAGASARARQEQEGVSRTVSRFRIPDDVLEQESEVRAKEKRLAYLLGETVKVLSENPELLRKVFIQHIAHLMPEWEPEFAKVDDTLEDSPYASSPSSST